MRIQALAALLLVSCSLQVHGFGADFAARHISQKINKKIDPKIRRALLNVLNKFENEGESTGSSKAVIGESSDTSEGEVHSSEKTETYSSAKAEPYSSARTESYSTTADGDTSRGLERGSNEDDTEKRISDLVDVRFDSSSQAKNDSYAPMDEEELYSHLRGKLEEQEEKKNEVKVETLKLDESNGSVMQQIKEMLASLDGSSKMDEMRVISVPLTTQKSDAKVSSTESQETPNLIRQGFSSNGVTVDVIQAPLLVSYDLKDDFGTPSVSLGTFNKNFADFMAKELKTEFDKLHAPLDLQNLLSNDLPLKNQNTTRIQESSDGVLQLQSLGLLNGGINTSDINGGPLQFQTLGLVNTRGFDFGTPQVNPNLNLQNLVLRQQSINQNSTGNKASDFGALQLQKILNSGIVQSQGQLLQSGDARFPGASNLEINQLGGQNFGLGFREDLTNEALKQLQLQQTQGSNEALRSAIERFQKSQTSAEGTARTQQAQKPQFQFQGDFNPGFQPQTLNQPDGIRLALGQLLQPQLKGGFELPTGANDAQKYQGQLNLGLGQQRQFNLEGFQSQDNDIEQKLRDIMRKKQELEAEKQQYLLELEKRKNSENQKQSPQQPTPNIGTRFGSPSFNNDLEQNQKSLSNFGTFSQDGINIQKSYELSSPHFNQFNGFGFPGFFGSNSPIPFQPPPQFNEKQTVNKQNAATADASKKATQLQNFPTPQFAPPAGAGQFNPGSSNILFSGFPNPISNDIFNEIPSDSFRDIRRPQIFANNLQQHQNSVPFSDQQFNQQTPVQRFDAPPNNFGFGQPNFIPNAFPNFSGFR